ncbi:hypothetical protein IQ07DRAFT_610450 [Pyrenochaeta sp. DS3sAY3a]|nr:hypothetical protein IQ07DRAFT_610450 [Pyrenochaeta sp. DS3sAY3a]
MASPQGFDWAQSTFDALSDPSNKLHSDNNWSSFSAVGSMQSPAFTIPPSLLSTSSIERFGQVTPPEELSPALLSALTREDSIPVDQLRNEANWPVQHNDQPEVSGNAQSPQYHSSEPATKRRRTSRQAPANQTQANHPPPPSDGSDNGNLQPPKRKRGRPKSQPQMIEAFTTDGFPFQVSSARQSHLEKNRVAAHKCRQRKKEYINGLEGRAREFSSKNKALKENVAMLREEVLELKNMVLKHAGCGFWAVDEYLARCAGDLLGMDVPMHSMSSRRPTIQSTDMSHSISEEQQNMESSPAGSSIVDEFGGLELLRDFDEDDEDDM